VLHLAAKLGRHKLIVRVKERLRAEGATAMRVSSWDELVAMPDSKRQLAVDVAQHHVQTLLHEDLDAVWRVLSTAMTPNLPESPLAVVRLNLQLVPCCQVGATGQRYAVNAVNHLGFTPLMFTAVWGDDVLGQVAVSKEPLPDTRSPDGLTAYMWCQWARSSAVLSGEGDRPCAVLQYLKRYGREATDQDLAGLERLEDAWSNAAEAKVTAADGTDPAGLFLLSFSEATQKILHDVAPATAADQSTLACTVLKEVEEYLEQLRAPAELGEVRRAMSAPLQYHRPRGVRATRLPHSNHSQQDGSPNQRRSKGELTADGSESSASRPTSTDSATNLEWVAEHREQRRMDLVNNIVSISAESRRHYIAAYAAYDQESRDRLARLFSDSIHGVAAGVSKYNSACHDLPTLLQHARACQRKLIDQMKRLVKEQFAAAEWRERAKDEGKPPDWELVMLDRQGRPTLACTIIDPGPKGETRIQQKVETKYNFDYSRVCDAARCSIVYEDPADLVAFEERLSWAGQVGLETETGHIEKLTLILAQNRFRTPTSLDWRDLQLFLAIPIGDDLEAPPEGRRTMLTHIAEVQAQLRGLTDVRKDQHHVYEQYREEIPKVFKTHDKAEINAVTQRINDVLRDPAEFRRKHEHPLIDTPISVWSWESADMALARHCAQNLGLPRGIGSMADLKVQIHDKIRLVNLTHRQETIEARPANRKPPAAVGEHAICVGQHVLPTALYDNVPLWTWLLQLQDVHDFDVGSPHFPDKVSLINSGKLFVQATIAAGHGGVLSPARIFALFIMGLDSCIQGECCTAMMENPLWPLQDRTFSVARLRRWAPLIVQTQLALGQLRVQRYNVLFRAVDLSADRPLMRELIQNYDIGRTFAWTEFGTCTPLLECAAPWVHDEGAVGIVFLIRGAQNAKDISHFTTHPWQREAMYPAGTEFRVAKLMSLEGALSIVCAARGSTVPDLSVDVSFVEPPRLVRAPDAGVVVIELEEMHQSRL